MLAANASPLFASVVNGNDALLFDLVEWLAKESRSYAQTMAAWSTYCPCLTIWEDAVDRGFVFAGEAGRVTVTEAGRKFLLDTRP
jgi:hypothetical protein